MSWSTGAPLNPLINTIVPLPFDYELVIITGPDSTLSKCWDIHCW